MKKEQLIKKMAMGLMVWTTCGAAFAAGTVQIKVSEKGLQSLKYQGTEYCDPRALGEVGFTGNGASLQGSGFSTTPTSVSVAGNTVTQTYPWGTLVVVYEAKDADLTVTTTLNNTSGNGLSGWKVNVFQLNNRIVFRGGGGCFGFSPDMQWSYYYEQMAGVKNVYEHKPQQQPHVYWWVDRAAPFEAAPVKVMFADLTGTWGTGVERVKADGGDRWPVSVTADGWELPPVAPLQTHTVKVCVRFRPASDSALTVCADGYEAWGRYNRRDMIWTDRRPIGAYFGCRDAKRTAKNPNGWFKDPKVDTTTPEGCAAFAKQLLAEIDASIAVLKQVDAQGVIWWDMEGQCQPQPITYVGDPRVLDPKHPSHKFFAPELDTMVVYKGQQMALVDACFKKWKDAGLKTGITIRPQRLTYGKDGQPNGQSWTGGDTEPLPKAKYANARWGVTIFYVDSISAVAGYWIVDQIPKQIPNTLLLPEWATPRTYQASAQFSYTGMTGYTRGVPEELQAAWPDAFCGLGNVNYGDLNARKDLLVAVQRGNLPVFDCFYNNIGAITAIKEVYAKTGTKHTPLVKDQNVTNTMNQAMQVKLVATDEDGDAVTYSIMAPPEHGTLTGFNAKAGTATYIPEKGYAGTDFFTFKATDATGLNSNRGKVTVGVK